MSLNTQPQQLDDIDEQNELTPAGSVDFVKKLEHAGMVSPLKQRPLYGTQRDRKLTVQYHQG